MCNQPCNATWTCFCAISHVSNIHVSLCNQRCQVLRICLRAVSYPFPITHCLLDGYLSIGVHTTLHAEEVEEIKGILDGRAHVSESPCLQVLQLGGEGSRRLLPPRLHTPYHTQCWVGTTPLLLFFILLYVCVCLCV